MSSSSLKGEVLVKDFLMDLVVLFLIMMSDHGHGTHVAGIIAADCDYWRYFLVSVFL